MSSPNDINWEQAFSGRHDVLLQLPGLIDEEWCTEFQVHYGSGVKRTLLSSPDFCLLQTNSHGTMPELYSVDVLDWTQSLLSTIEGKVMRVVLVPGMEDDTKHDPYLVLEEVLNPGRPLTHDARQQVWVPLAGKEELLLFD